MNRVRQLAQKDEEHKMLSKESLVLITKATEMFIKDLSAVCGNLAKMQKRKTLQLNDIINVASNIDKFHFIKGKLLIYIVCYI